MQLSTQKNIINLSNAKALRRAREMLKLTRNDLAKLLNCSYKLVEKYENARVNIDEERLKKILGVMNLSTEEFKKIKRGKNICSVRREKIVVSNQQRRSYKRVITKEVKTLKTMRLMKKLTQDQASALCGYSRPSIGHIENGRIELDTERIKHIVKSYGGSLDEYYHLLKESIPRDEIIRECDDILMRLGDEKLSLAYNLIKNLSN